MKKMHYDKQCNDDLIQNKINIKTAKNFKSSTSARETENTEINSKNSERILSFQVNTKNRNTINEHEASDIGTYTEHTSASCTSSTDSGVNVSDNDEIPPSPTSSHLHSFPSSSSSSSEERTTTKPFNKQFHKNNKNPNRDNNINNSRGNNYNNHFIDNYDRDHNNDDEDDDDNNSTKIDNKLNSEQCQKRQQQQLQQQQQFIKVDNSNNGGNNTQYQQNQNVIESDNSLNISQQRDSTIPKIRVTFPPPPAATTTTTTSNNDKPSLQHNEFTNRPQRSASISSSLSMSSIMSTQSDDPPSKMHHRSGSVVSIRSINSSTIITSDSDSDSDLSGDTEGAHSNYVIKKLGTQVSYPPKHPAIPNINSGHTVLNQKVVPNCEHPAASPLATLAAIGDSIGAAQALGPVSSFSAVPQRPQIGSIALSNSSDVTFGDKHFYEGPVTIQQFLIDSRDKWKETNEKENPTFVNENGETSNNAKDINPSAEQSGTLYGYISKRKKIFIPGVLAFMTMLIVGTILGSRTLSDSKSKLVLGNSEESRNIIPINSTIDTNGHYVNDDDQCAGNGTLCLIDRDVWRAHPQKSNLDKQNLPLHRVIISHTASEPCETIKICAERVRVIQEFHMNSLGWDDIGYNFLISSDGRVYVGRGWDDIGAHTKGYNTDSVGITFIGTYMKIPPTEEQLNACLLLLDEGLRLNKLAPNYNIYGARQFAATESPGTMLYNEIKKWKRWSVDINLHKPKAKNN